MHGRNCVCLFACVLVILSPARLSAQSEPRALEASIPAKRGLDSSALGRTGFESSATADLRRHFSITSNPFGFTQLSEAAGMIFSGTVASVVKHPASSGQPVETVSITFHVDTAFRGTSVGQDLTVKEWIGLWTEGQRYRVGDRALLFLYPPSKLGLTSSVAGPIGRFEVDTAGRVSLSAQHLSAFRTDPVLRGRSHATLKDFGRALELIGSKSGEL